MYDRSSQEKDVTRPLSALPEVDHEFAQLLASTIIPKTIIGVSTVLLAMVMFHETGRGVFLTVSIAAVVVYLLRIGCVLTFRWRHDLMTHLAFERLYGAGAIAFALVLAAFAAASFDEPSGVGRVMATILIISFCAGIVARASVCPWIAIWCVLVSAGPLVLLSALEKTTPYQMIAVVVFLLISGSINTVFQIHRITRDHLMTRRRFADLTAIDSLTGMPNRSMLYQRLDILFSHKKRGSTAIHFIDLDHFKEINDRFGHAAGDRVLEVTAKRLRSLLDHEAFAARVGGDEFILVQQRVADADDAYVLAERITVAVRKPIVFGGKTLVIGASTGVQIVEAGTLHWRDVIAAADQALYEAKRRGRGQAVVNPFSNEQTVSPLASQAAASGKVETV